MILLFLTAFSAAGQPAGNTSISFGYGHSIPFGGFAENTYKSADVFYIDFANSGDSSAVFYGLNFNWVIYDTPNLNYDTYISELVDLKIQAGVKGKPSFIQPYFKGMAGFGYVGTSSSPLLGAVFEPEDENAHFVESNFYLGWGAGFGVLLKPDSKGRGFGVDLGVEIHMSTRATYLQDDEYLDEDEWWRESATTMLNMVNIRIGITF